LLECDGGHKFFAGELVPRGDECDCGDDAGVEECADDNGHPDGAEESLRAKVWAGFFGGLADGFESGHEVGDDLNHQENRDPRRVGEERLDIRG
jgi:hypothetical protein